MLSLALTVLEVPDHQSLQRIALLWESTLDVAEHVVGACFQAEYPPPPKRFWKNLWSRP